MKPDPVMTLPNARFSTFVTLNCSVKPTALMASSAAVTRPKPTAETKTSMSPSAAPRPYRRGRADCAHPDAALISAADSDGPDRPVALRVALDREALSGVVPLVEHRRPDGADVLDVLALGERGLARGVGVDDDRAGGRRGHLRDVGVVDARLGRVGRVHCQRHDHDRVVVGDRVQVGVPLCRLRHLLARRVQRGRVGPVGRRRRRRVRDDGVVLLVRAATCRSRRRRPCARSAPARPGR